MGRLGLEGDRLVNFQTKRDYRLNHFLEESWACRCVGSQIVFFGIFVSSSRGSEPRSARAGAVETQLFIFEPASKKTRFSNNVKGISDTNGFQI